MSLFYACPELLTSLVLRELPKGPKSSTGI